MVIHIEQTINVHRPYHQSRKCRVPVALITAADGVCHPTSAALISADTNYPDRYDVEHDEYAVLAFRNC